LFSNVHNLVCNTPYGTWSWHPKCKNTNGAEIGAQMTDTRWRQLCIAIMHEADPQRLLTLVEALNRELEQRDEQSWRGHSNARDLAASRG